LKNKQEKSETDSWEKGNTNVIPTMFCLMHCPGCRTEDRTLSKEVETQAEGTKWQLGITEVNNLQNRSQREGSCRGALKI
jgi:hypothetical protein